MSEEYLVEVGRLGFRVENMKINRYLMAKLEDINTTESLKVSLSNIKIINIDIKPFVKDEIVNKFPEKIFKVVKYNEDYF